jgi:hypothetical protein
MNAHLIFFTRDRVYKLQRCHSCRETFGCMIANEAIFRGEKAPFVVQLFYILTTKFTREISREKETESVSTVHHCR